MTIYYEEYDTTVADNVTDLVAKIVAHADWDDVFAVSITSTTTGSNSSSSTNLTVASTAAWSVGDPVRIVGGTTGTIYYRTIVSITSGTVMVMSASFGVSETTGSTVTYHSNILKTTTSGGAQMVVEVARSENIARLMYRTHYTHNGSVSGGASSWRSVTYQSGTVLTSHVVHAILSLSNDHLFISLEGPRPNETGAFSAVYGSLRQYMMMSEVILYRDDDTIPCVFSWGNVAATAGAYLSRSFLGDVSRNFSDTFSLVRARLATVMVPIFNSGSATSTVTTFNSRSSIDGTMFMWPYMVVEDAEGLRGRLKMFHYIGHNRGAVGDDPLANPDELVTMGSVIYKTLAPGKGDGSGNGSGAFGWFQGSAQDAIFGSPIVAVPYDDV